MPLGKTMYPVVTASSHRLEGNDSRHNKPDPNAGGGPSTRTRKPIPPVHRGGFGQHGQQRYVKASMGGGRGPASNPASRGGTPHSFHPHTDNPNQGGGVQVRPGRDMKRQFGTSGQRGVPSYPHAHPQPSGGNTGGRMATRITGRFNNKSKGANSGAPARAGGKWGGPPVRLDS